MNLQFGGTREEWIGLRSFLITSTLGNLSAESMPICSYLRPHRERAVGVCDRVAEVHAVQH